MLLASVFGKEAHARLKTCFGLSPQVFGFHSIGREEEGMRLGSGQALALALRLQQGCFTESWHRAFKRPHDTDARVTNIRLHPDNLSRSVEDLFALIAGQVIRSSSLV